MTNTILLRWEARSIHDCSALSTALLFVLPSIVNGSPALSDWINGQLCSLLGRCTNTLSALLSQPMALNAVVHFCIFTWRHRDVRVGIAYLLTCRHMDEQQLRLVTATRVEELRKKSLAASVKDA